MVKIVTDAGVPDLMLPGRTDGGDTEILIIQFLTDLFSQGLLCSNVVLSPEVGCVAYLDLLISDVEVHGLFRSADKVPEAEPDSELGRWYLRARYGRANLEEVFLDVARGRAGAPS